MMKSKDSWKKKRFNNPRWLKRTRDRQMKRNRLNNV